MFKWIYLVAMIVAPSLALGVVNLTYWTSTNPEEVLIAKELILEWNRVHPQVQVKAQPIPAGSSSEEVLLAAVVARTTPDLCSNINPAIIPRFVKANAFVQLDTFSDFHQTMQNRMKISTLNRFISANGHWYQVPWKSNPVMLAINKDIFRQFKLTPPTTYAEFLQISKTLSRDTDGDGIRDRWAMNPSITPIWYQRLFDFYALYAAASGGKTLLEKDRPIFQSAAGIDVLTFLREAFHQEYFPKSNSGRNLFLDEKVAMTMVGPWAIKYFERARSRPFEFAFVPLPTPHKIKGKTYTYGDPKNIAIFANSKNPQQAWNFVKFLISKKADLLLLEKASQIPIRKNMNIDPEFVAVVAQLPRLKPFIKQMEAIVSTDYSIHLVQILDHLAQQYEAAAVYGVVSPKKALINAAQYVENIYKFW